MKTKRVRKAIVFLSAAVCALVCAVALIGCKEKGGATRSRYTIAAQVNAQDMTATARCEVLYVNTTETELGEVWFHLYPAAYRDGAQFTPVTAAETETAYPNGVSYGNIEIVGVEGGTYEIGGRDEDILKVQLPASILPTQSARIVIDYTLKLPNMRHRFGYCDQTINLGNWFPVECAYDNGFADDPYYANGDPFCLPVCDYDVTVTAPAEYTAAMPAASERTETGNDATTHCSLEKARDFAVVLGKFDTVSQASHGVDVTYYYTADDNAQAHLTAACDALDYFSQCFGAYPYKTYAVVQTAFNQGGMEYTGLVYVSDAVQGDMITEVIVHETAHQWWYGIVGNDQVKNAWMDEALAEFSTTLFYKNRPDYKVAYNDRIADAMGGFSLYCELSKCADTSMNRALGDYASGTEYSYMTYVKGQIMYDSLLQMLGEDTLVAGLRNYASKCAFTLATPDDLIAALEQTSKRDLKSFMSSYIEGTAKLYSMS